MGLIDTFEAWGASLNESLRAALETGSPKAILIVQAVPVLASGKVDLQATVELARQSTATH